MRISSGGKVTIPKQIREKLGLTAGTEVEVFGDASGVRIRKVTPFVPGHGAELVERLRRGSAHVTMTTDEIMALTRGYDEEDEPK